MVLALAAVSLSIMALDVPVSAAVPATVDASALFSDPAVTPGRSGSGGRPPPPRVPSGQPVTQVRWGVPASGSGQSGLGFDDGSTGSVMSSEPFEVGRLTHFNFPISDGTGIERLRMSVRVAVASSGGAFELAVPVSLSIDETNNDPPCPHGPPGGPCTDAVSIGALEGSPSASQVLGDTRFTLTIVGFEDAAGTMLTVGDINIDRTDPSIAFTGNTGTYSIDQVVDISCQATDSLSGVSSSTCPEAMGAALDFGPGTYTLTAMATDRAGNTTTLTTSFTVAVTSDSLCALTHAYASGDGG